MHERHENEQYFFDDDTLAHLGDFLSLWSSPCCICAPLLGKAAVERGLDVTILDIDERFSGVAGYQTYDLYRPHRLETRFDLILCDPPFHKVSLSQLFSALRVLSHDDFNQTLMVSYLVRRSNSVTGTFAPFNLQPTGYHPGYRTVKPIPKNDIEFYSNLPSEKPRFLSRQPR